MRAHSRKKKGWRKKKIEVDATKGTEKGRIVSMEQVPQRHFRETF